MEGNEQKVIRKYPRKSRPENSAREISNGESKNIAKQITNNSSKEQGLG